MTAALVRMAEAPAAPSIVEAHRLPLRSEEDAESVVDQILQATGRIDAPLAAVWGVAIPGPFDYERGTGTFAGVGKFASLNGYPLGAELRGRLQPTPRWVRFVNDADAFGMGEHAAGAARGHARAICLTLGTGIGSAFIDAGSPVNDGPLVPPDGSAHLLTWQGAPLEDTVSRRAIRARYAELTGAVLDVHEIAERARAGEPAAMAVFDHALRALGEALAPWVRRFGASVLVVGGSIARSWDLVAGPLRAGLDAGSAAGPRTAASGTSVTVLPAEHPDEAALYGAAMWALRWGFSRSSPASRRSSSLGPTP